MTKHIGWLILIILFLISTNLEAARKKKPRFKPYYLVSAQMSDFTSTISNTRELISKSNFNLVGDYSPYENAHIFVLTHPTLLEASSQSDFGGYSAVIRMAVTRVDEQIQLSYVNPFYMSTLYHISEVPEVIAELKNTFGEAKTFGSKRGLTKRKIKGFQYMMFMPEFEDHDKLASFDNHQQALDTVKDNLASGKYKLSKVFEVAVPGKDEVLIGVTINEGDGADTVIMPIIDKGEIKHTAHLPYAILISGNKVYSQAGKFRIASSFPDLSMGTFMDISDAPDGIKNSLKQLTVKVD